MTLKNTILKATLVLSIISTIIYMFYVMFDGERRGMKFSTLIENYTLKPGITDRRIVVVIPCNDQTLANQTLRSILSQSVRVNDIAVETNEPNLISEEDRLAVTVHKPDTTGVREIESDTIIIFVKNGEWYEYDFIEREVHDILKRTLQ